MLYKLFIDQFRETNLIPFKMKKKDFNNNIIYFATVTKFVTF